MPTLDPARCPAPLVSCRKRCPQVTSAEEAAAKDGTDSPWPHVSMGGGEA